MKVFLLLALFCGLSILSGWAQKTMPMWEAKLTGGTYLVTLNSITSVSTQEYVVDGAFRVYEMTVDTYGSSLGRFYFIDLNTAPAGTAAQGAIDRVKEAAQQIADKSSRVMGGSNDTLQTLVTKNYPSTTHAKTVEYRLKSRADIDALFKSLETAWRTGRDASIKME
jgi:hypothetical protein